jgi:hypothetical protein
MRAYRMPFENSSQNRVSNLRRHSNDIAHLRHACPTVAFKRKIGMNITLSVGPLIALIAGILILIVPRLLNYIVALYLIIIGILGLFGAR